MNDFIQVQTTTDSEETAQVIAQRLVQKQLAACVQISGPITSVYRWQGNVETATEWICTAKTTAAHYAAVEQQIRQLHSYDEPEIIASNLVQWSASYGTWLRDQLADPNPTK